MNGLTAHSHVDGAARRALCSTGIGIGLANPAIAQHRPRRGAAGAQRNGLWHQQHLPHRRPRDRRGGARSRLPASPGNEPRGSQGAPVPRLAKAVASGGVRAASELAHGQIAVIYASMRAFASAMNGILAIGAALTLLGAIAAAVLVRARTSTPAGRRRR